MQTIGGESTFRWRSLPPIWIMWASRVSRSMAVAHGSSASGKRLSSAIGCPSAHGYNARPPGEFPSGQRGPAVNRLAPPSEVRILPPPSLPGAALPEVRARRRSALGSRRAPEQEPEGGGAEADPALRRMLEGRARRGRDLRRRARGG